jgi:hypothetical protein
MLSAFQIAEKKTGMQQHKDKHYWGCLRLKNITQSRPKRVLLPVGTSCPEGNHFALFT